MIPDPRKLALSEHQRWLGYLQPEGLVVSPLALVDSQVQLDTGSYASVQDRFTDALKTDPITGQLVIEHFAYFARDFLGWKDELLSIFSVTAEVPEGLRISTGEHGELLKPDAAYKYFKPADPAREYLLLVRQLDTGVSLDELPDGKKERGWSASPHQKFERLLRETGVPIGVLCNGSSVRLIYSPKGENSGSITFPVAFMTEIPGRTVASALDLLLSHRRLITVPEGLRLPALLRKSRDYQAHVSTALSHQVLEALFELGRGFQAADEKSHGSLLSATWQRDPQEIYGGLISSMLRMVFLLYAEDRSLMPTGELYQRNYSVQGLFESLRTDQERYPDTMDDRFGGWPRLLTLFRAVHGGCRHLSMSLPARKGHLFDPDRFPFLEGRATANDALPGSLPRISDGTLHRVLDLLLYLDGERLSYRTLDVEQIGSVYETIMGFEVQKATGRSVALKPKKSHGAPVHIDLDSLLTRKPAERDKFLAESADTKLPPAAAKALKESATVDDLLAALEKRIDRRATPHPLPAGSIILQPNDERRRSGSHYTPRSFTQPIVRKTLEPLLNRLGRHPRPEAILDLKICDIAVGSAAFLVETCRQLADELVSSWHFHKCLPVIPPDEDELLYARRLIAQRCLYGVDRNPMAVDLAKLSLWLATLAKDHPFTFLDHAIRCGDSLVGLTRRQIETFTWKTGFTTGQLWEQEVRKRTAAALRERQNLLGLGDDYGTPQLKREKLEKADELLDLVRFIGDAAVAAFFAADKDKAREAKRAELAERIADYLGKGDLKQRPTDEVKALRGGKFPVTPFHWEIEYPEVFDRENPGFDAFVGNPPFAGKNTLITGNCEGYVDWLKTLHEESHGNADLVAHFFRRAFNLLRSEGCFGLIATNSIGQGDTRSTGLRWICLNGGTIYAAHKRFKWPGQVAVVVSVVHVVTGSFSGKSELNGKVVPIVSAYLFHAGGHENPVSLQANAGKSFQGCILLGMGFTFDDTDKTGVASPIAEMRRLVAHQPRNEERTFPYIGGDELNESPTHSHLRYVINFSDWPLRRDNVGTGASWCNATVEQQNEWLRSGVVPLDFPDPVAADYPDLLQIVEERVKPERMAQKDEGGRRKWWQLLRPRGELSRAINGMERVLVVSRVRATGFAFVKPNMVFSEQLVVFPLSSFGSFVVLQSRAHEMWSHFFSGTALDLIRYAPSDCFETFPFPAGFETNAALEAAGREYYEFRAALMQDLWLGLTEIYNLFHSPDDEALARLEALYRKRAATPDWRTAESVPADRSPLTLYATPTAALAAVQHLRELHAAMDTAVLTAYGWTDLLPKCTCEFLLDYEDDESESAAEESGSRKKKKPWRYRWPDEIRDEVLARLLKLNAERAEEERIAATSAGKPKTARGKRSTLTTDPLQGELL